MVVAGFAMMVGVAQTAVVDAVVLGCDHVHSGTCLRTDGYVPERALERKDDKVYCNS